MSDARPKAYDTAVEARRELTRYEDTIPQLADVGIDDALRARIEQFMGRYPRSRSATLPALMAAQRHHGWLSPDAIRQVAAVMQETPAYLESVASFYDMYELKPRGKHTIYMCTNISCMMRGAGPVFEALEAAAAGDDDVYVREFECLGACDLAPMASVDHTYVGPLTPEDATTILAQLRRGEQVLPEKQLRDASRERREDVEGPAPPGVGGSTSSESSDQEAVE